MSGNGITRREALTLSGAALGALALSWNGKAMAGPPGGGPSALPPSTIWNPLDPPYILTQRDTFFAHLRPFVPDEPLGRREMRISFMGTSVIERRAQVRSSVFVELGNGESFVFDCGSGVVSNYVAMQVPWSRMRKVFLTHLHGDHTSDLTHVYCFGPQGDGKSPLYLFGPSRSGIRNPDFGKDGVTQYINPEYYEDGTIDFARHFREMNRWHTESQSFVGTRWQPGHGMPAAEGDGYDIYTTELDWTDGTTRHWSTNTTLNPGNVPFRSGGGVAYETADVRISFFPSIHDRNGALGYKLEWLTEGLSMIFTGDSKPSDLLLAQATAGAPVDVLISEIVVDPQIWVSRQSGITDPDDPTFEAAMVNAEAVQESSHTPQKAFGYMVRQMQLAGKAPRLAVGTHFQATDDTIILAMEALRSWYKGWTTIATDLMVLNVTAQRIEQRAARVSDYSWSARWQDPRQVNGAYPPKYADLDPCNPYYPSAPLKQFSRSLLQHVIPGCVYDPTGWQCENAKAAAKCRGP
ncbi:MAG: MBL fold metallo-hydrolase [Burkholderiales bacterium]